MNRSNSILAVLSVVGLTILGGLFAFSIPSSVFPEITFNRAIIMADAGDLPPEQMIVTVTRPLEEAAYGVVGVSLVRSTTSRGTSEIDVTFSESVDPTTSYQLLNAALGEVRGRLPNGTQIDTRLLTTGTFPIVDLSMTSKIRTLPELTDIAFYDVVPSLHRIPGRLPGRNDRRKIPRVRGANRSGEIARARSWARRCGERPRQGQHHRVGGPRRRFSSDVADGGHREYLATRASRSGSDRERRRAAGDGARYRCVELGITEDYIRTAAENGPALSGRHFPPAKRQHGGHFQPARKESDGATFSAAIRTCNFRYRMTRPRWSRNHLTASAMRSCSASRWQ